MSLPWANNLSRRTDHILDHSHTRRDSATLEKDAGRDRRIEDEPAALDPDVSRQPSEAEAGDPRPEEADRDEDASDDDQGPGHRSVAAASPRPEVEADALIDELERIGPFIVGPGVDHADLDHLVEKVLPPGVGHGADAELQRVARIDDAGLLQLGDREGDLCVGDVGIIRLDQRVAFGTVAVEIVIPADRRRVDKTLHEIRAVFSTISVRASRSGSHRSNSRSPPAGTRWA